MTPTYINNIYIISKCAKFGWYRNFFPGKFLKKLFSKTSQEKNFDTTQIYHIFDFLIVVTLCFCR